MRNISDNKRTENTLEVQTAPDLSSMRPENMSDEDWQYILNSNPYASPSVNESKWDAFVSALGFRSKYDRAEAERLQNYKNYVSQSLERWRQDQYNLPINQLEREREAGINSNISGNVDNVASSGSPESLAPLSDMSDAYEDDYKFGDIIQIGLSAISSICQIGNGIADMSKRKLELRNLDSSLTDSIFNFTESFVNKTLPDDTTIPEFEKMIKDGLDPKEAFSIIMDNTIDVAAKQAKDGTPWFRNKRNQKLFQKSLSEYKQSIPYKELKNRAFSTYKDSYVNKVKDKTELDNLMSNYTEFVELVNEYYYPTMQADYKTKLDDAETLLKGNETLRKQFELDTKIIGKEKELVDKQFEVAGKQLDYEKESFETAKKRLAVELVRLEAQEKICNKIESKLNVSDDMSLLSTLYWNSILNSLNANLIKDAAHFGIDLGKTVFSPTKKFIHTWKR